MVRIIFEYQDDYTKPGQWSTQTGVFETVAACIEFYGLDQPGVRYRIVKVEEVD